MRYKFQAWIEAEKKMVQVAQIDLLDRSIGYYDVSQCKEDAEIFDFIRNKSPNADCPFERCKLRQYTGLRDIKRTEEYPNGQEIYEGDVVKAREQSNMATFTGYVHFLNGQYWVNYIGYESYYVPLIQLVNAVYEPIEVIGNIYDNPELLQKVEEVESHE
ncbi:hypothetical protein QJ48_04265 [Paenibacillus sp. A3]|uniref:YopX family protein n=1 Tax=Paenibacillus sp. A3 TaxID=1337054 RepID=UPI0006D55204|nr:YopX family protein [Paenibacillus sp. A3]KPV60743.1 hypothetical protein QJ48_04265 [Paenibacillus sp. A3]